MIKESYGKKREEHIRNIAAHLGVADFVYFASPVSKGAAQREAAGDGILLVGKHGAILQVKTRDPEKGINDSDNRAKAWIKKNTRKAVKQGLGTKRELARRREMGSPLEVFPVRALTLTKEKRELYKCTISQDTREWPIIVILEHPQKPEIDLGFMPGVVYFGFSDWNEIHQRLRSISATIHYVKRILHDGIHVALWQEVNRYTALCAADEDFAFGSPGTFPYLADPNHFDELGTDIFHDVINRVWPDDATIPWRSAKEYREIVEFLDVIPPRLQSIVGRWILRKRSEIANGERMSSGWIRLEFQDRLVFACSHIRHWDNRDEWSSEFMLLTSLRHIQAIESGAENDTKTLGIAILVENRDGKTGVSYDFILLNGYEGRIDIPKELRRNFEWRYGIHDHKTGTTLEMKIKPKELCPCMSGRMYEVCCDSTH